MSQKFKRLKSQIDNQKQVLIPKTQKSQKKTTKQTKQQTYHDYPDYTTNPNSNQNINQSHSKKITKNSISKQPTLINSKQVYSKIKLNRIQSEYIKPISSQSMPKTPKTTKLNSNKIIIDSTKLKKHPSKDQSHCKDYMHTQPKQKLSKNLEQFNKKPEFFQSPIQDPAKIYIKTSKMSIKSLTRQHSSFKNQPGINLIIVKEKSKTNKNESQPQKREMKQFSKKGLESIKVTQKNKKTESLLKTPSTCSVKKYYIIQKSKQQKNISKKKIALTTHRGLANPQEKNPSGYRKSSANLSNTAQSQEKEQQILQKVQRILEQYRMNLDEEIEKRKNLQIQHNLLKDQLTKASKHQNKSMN